MAISHIIRYNADHEVCNSSQPERSRAILTHFLRYLQALDRAEAQAPAAAAIHCDLALSGPADLRIFPSWRMPAR